KYPYSNIQVKLVWAAAGMAVRQTIGDEKIAESAEKVGAHLMEHLGDLKQRHELIGDIRGTGLAIGVELVSDRKSKAPAKREAALTVYRAFELGLVLFYVGINSNILEFTPPLTLSMEDVDQGMALLDMALSDVETGRVDPATISAFAGW